MTFVLTIAIIKNGARESRKIPKIIYLEYFEYTTIISLDETVITVRRNTIWRPFLK